MDFGKPFFFKGFFCRLTAKEDTLSPFSSSATATVSGLEASFPDTPCYHAFVMLSFMISPWPQASQQAMTWRYAACKMIAQYNWKLLFGPVTASFPCPFMNMHQGKNKKLNDVDKEA